MKEHQTIKEKNKSGFWQGILYGIIPHTFCILFVVLSIVGATGGAVFLRRFFVFPYLFQLLVVISFVFATISATFYLRRNGILSWSGIKRKWKYLSIMYGTTIAINLLMFYVVFPAVGNIRTNASTNSSNSNNVVAEQPVSPEVQQIEMDQIGSGYRPNSFTVKMGKPVRWLIHSKSRSCSASIYAPKLNISQDLQPGDNVIEFTPKEAGTFSFSCYMGMYRGTIKVEN